MPTYRFYRTPQIGTGQTPTTAFRSKLADLVTGAGETFWDYVNDARPVRYALALAESATHTAIDADGSCLALSEELADLAAVQAWLDGTALSLSSGIIAQLETDGVNTGWADAATKRGALFRYLTRLQTVTQNLKRLKNGDSMAFLAANLDANVSVLTPAQRQKVRDWMIAKGLDTSWIVLTGTNPPQTKIRQVVHYVLSNIEWPVPPLGPVQF